MLRSGVCGLVLFEWVGADVLAKLIINSPRLFQHNEDWCTLEIGQDLWLKFFTPRRSNLICGETMGCTMQIAFQHFMFHFMVV